MNENDYINFKVRIGNLLDCFPTGRIRRKDMDNFNKEIDSIVNLIEYEVNEDLDPRKLEITK